MAAIESTPVQQRKQYQDEFLVEHPQMLQMKRKEQSRQVQCDSKYSKDSFMKKSLALIASQRDSYSMKI
jgi:hypothetical protein